MFLAVKLKLAGVYRVIARLSHFWVSKGSKPLKPSESMAITPFSPWVPSDRTCCFHCKFSLGEKRSPLEERETLNLWCYGELFTFSGSCLSRGLVGVRCESVVLKEAKKVTAEMQKKGSCWLETSPLLWVLELRPFSSLLLLQWWTNWMSNAASPTARCHSGLCSYSAE